MENIIFYGAGRIGKRMLALFHEFDVQVNMFLDNSSEKWNSEYCGVKVRKPENIDDFGNSLFFITCNQENEIRKQLNLMGIPELNIRKGNTRASMLFYLTVERKLKLSISVKEKKDVNSQRERFLIDLQNGIVLGGVESWSLQTMRTLETMGVDVGLFTSNLYKHTIECDSQKVLELKYKDEPSEKKRIEICLQSIIDENPDTVLCNFISYHFFAAVNAKKDYLKNTKIIVVLHNDEEVYYDGYITFKDDIDYCLVISSVMRTKLLKRGFPSDKIIILPWKITQGQGVEHLYSASKEAIRIGYAGRVVIEQKRMDFMLDIARKLKDLGMDYQLEIAGSGSFEIEMKKRIVQQGLEKRVKLIGYVEQKDIKKFWERQDIMLSCSEWEGHSISQCEAMAAGTVPVVTDVSGARDDVKNGYNGFVRPVGDLEGLVESLNFLYQHRDRLQEMGKNSFEIIKKKYGSFDEVEFWRNLIYKESLR